MTARHTAIADIAAHQLAGTQDYTEHAGEDSNWESFHGRRFLVYVTVSLTHLSVRATSRSATARNNEALVPPGSTRV